jgi:hypothetical protein
LASSTNLSSGAKSNKEIDNSLHTPSATFVGTTDDTPLTEQANNDNADRVDTPSEDSDSNSSFVTPPRAPRRPIPAATMALSVQKFIVPPVFSAAPSEDAIDWLERYELAAVYNRWTDADRARNFVMYLDGAARKWFLVHNHPNHWEDLPVRPNPADPTLPNLPAMDGLKKQFSAAFRQANFSLVQESKICQREQGVEEYVVAYFYDIINMCRVFNPTMSQEQQLQYLYRGLRPALLAKIYPLQPATTAEFLDLAKVQEETIILVNHKVLSQSLLAVAQEKKSSTSGVSSTHGRSTIKHDYSIFGNS